MLTKKPALNFVIFTALVVTFAWIVVQYSDKPIIVGGAGLAFIGFLTAVWIPFARKKAKRRQKPDDFGGHPNEWQ